jgi:hypothetical protein
LARDHGRAGRLLSAAAAALDASTTAFLVVALPNWSTSPPITILPSSWSATVSPRARLPSWKVAVPGVWPAGLNATSSWPEPVNRAATICVLVWSLRVP